MKKLLPILTLAAIFFSTFCFAGTLTPLPDFIIVGAQKSGTTALQSILRQHPNVKIDRREVHFFDNNYHKGVEWYLKNLPERTSSDDVIGEKSPYYLFHPFVPERVHALVPSVKIIMILRNPVDRAYSGYWHSYYLGVENLDFEEAIASESLRLQGIEEKMKGDISYRNGAHQNHSYISRSIYVEQIERWLSFFPKEQVLILSSTDLKLNQDAVMERIFAFLGVPNHPTYTPKPFHHDYPPMSLETRQHLSEFFKPYNKALEELLGIEFNWK